MVPWAGDVPRADSRSVKAVAGFAWFCPACNTKVHEVELQVRDIVADLPPVFTEFYNSDEGRTCPSCGTVHSGKG